MNYKRILSSVILFPIMAAIFIFGNTYLVDILLSGITIMSLYEFYKALKTKTHPIEIIGYIAAAMIAIIHIIPMNIVLKIIAAIIPTSILILFLKIIITNMKTNIIDIAVTFFGICYIVIFIMFVSLVRENINNGKILIWFIFITAWGTDIFAYIIGKTLGKHKFTKISPYKTIEGCIGGTIGAIILSIIYTLICNKIWGLQINYIYITLISCILSIVGQIGDLAASSIKRYTEIKDFSNLIPGHGGMLDRIDSMLFIAPFAYFLLSFL